MKKRYVFLFVFALIFAGIYFFSPSLESIVQKVVHQYGSKITGTDVSLKGFKLGLTSGEGRISKITVGNPKEYSSKNLFELGEIYVKINLKSLTTDTIIIENIEINKPVINYEMLSLTRNNISDIQNNIKRHSASKAVDENRAKAQTAPAKSNKKVIIKKLSIQNGEINAVAVKDNAVSVKLPAIILTDIGGSQKGESISATLTKVMSKILNTASETVVSSKISDLKGVAQKNLENIAGSVKDRVKSIGIFGK